jgi:hypothetical protein
MEVSVQLHALAALPPGKSPWYPLNRGLGGPQSQYRHSGEDKNSQPLLRLEPPIIQPIAQSYTELSQLAQRTKLPPIFKLFKSHFMILVTIFLTD